MMCSFVFAWTKFPAKPEGNSILVMPGQKHEARLRANVPAMTA
jgi:hypothetical protein